MVHRRNLQLALLCVLAVSGCVSKSRFNSGFSKTPFSKKSSAFSAPKQPLTQFALKSLTPKDKTPVKIVSPLDWFRSSPADASNVASQLSADQMASLSEKYEAALSARTGQSSSLASAQGVDSSLMDLARAKAMSGPTVPSYAAAPSVPPYSSAASTTHASVAAAQFAAPQNVQLQSAQLPLTQYPPAQSLTAQFTGPSVAQPNYSQPTRMSQTILPQSVQTRFTQPTAPANLAATQYATAATNNSPLTYPTTTSSSPAYLPANQPIDYPSTNQQPFPSFSTTATPASIPTYR